MANVEGWSGGVGVWVVDREGGREEGLEGATNRWRGLREGRREGGVTGTQLLPLL